MAGTINNIIVDTVPVCGVSMESGLDGRNNMASRLYDADHISASQWSPA